MPKKKSTGLVPQAKESARNVWLAGVGALALAEEEGWRLFERLVKMGAAYEVKNRKRLEGMLNNVRDVRHDVSAALGKAVAPVNDVMDQAMHRLGVPTRKEISTLSKRVEELTRAVERSRARPGAAARPRAEVTTVG
jgi:poly(hydroxyalkanoate) granule-associated protein